MDIKPLHKTIELLGGQAAAARALGVKPQAVYQWVKKGKVPASRAISIEIATGGKVTRHELRPDLYPDEPNRGARKKSKSH